MLWVYDVRTAGPRLDVDEQWPSRPDVSTAVMGQWWAGLVKCEACGCKFMAVLQLYVIERHEPGSPTICPFCGDRSVTVAKE
jgi:hypothetical protein